MSLESLRYHFYQGSHQAKPSRGLARLDRLDNKLTQAKHQVGLIRLEYMLRRAKIDGKTDGKFEYIVVHMNFDDSPIWRSNCIEF